jgi:hypothetical protein
MIFDEFRVVRCLFILCMYLCCVHVCMCVIFTCQVWSASVVCSYAGMCVCMCVCMCICMNVCMHVCMHVCMYVRVHALHARNPHLSTVLRKNIHVMKTRHSIMRYAIV